jgi:hypothetical protein
MTAQDIIILANPIIAAGVMAAACWAAIVFMGYHKPSSRPTPSSDVPAGIDGEFFALGDGDPAQRIDGVFISLSKAELDYLAKRSKRPSPRPEPARETSDS